MENLLRLFTAVTIFLMTSCGITIRPYQSGDVLLMDDFEDHKQNWEIYQDTDGSAVSFYKNGLVFLVEDEQKNQISTISHIYTDAEISITAEKISGPDNNFFGVICRYTDAGNYYGLIISSDGYYGIYKVENGIYDLLSSENMQYSGIIKQGEDTNIIKAVCAGNTLSLSVNGNQLAVVENSALSEGKIGLITGTYEQSGSTVLFDNLAVTYP